jgi:transposase
MAKRPVYWLSDAEWRRIEPLLPRGRRGAHRVYDRRVISGIVYMLHCGARWRDCPEVFGPYTTVHNRFNRWSRQGIWTDIFYALTGSTAMYGSLSVDSTYVKAHRSAAGAKGGLQQRYRPLARRADDQNPRADRRYWPSTGSSDYTRQHPRSRRSAISSGDGSRTPQAARRQSL